MHTRGFPKGVSPYIHHPVRTTQSSGMVCSVPSESHTDSILLGKRKQQGHKGPLGQQACAFPQCFPGPLKGRGRILPISLPRYVLHSALRRTLLDTPLGGG